MRKYKDDDEVVIKVMHNGETKVWGLKRDWDKLMELGKEMGVDSDEIIIAYEIALSAAKQFHRSTKFDSLLQDARSSMVLHIETVNVVGEIADEFDIDSQEVYSIYTKMLSSTKGRDAALRLNFDLHDPTPLVREVSNITREYVKNNLQIIKRDM